MKMKACFQIHLTNEAALAKLGRPNEENPLPYYTKLYCSLQAKFTS